MVVYTATRWLDGFLYPECPRWHQGSLWFSDQHSGNVYEYSAEGEILSTIEVPGNPSGLGWKPDGSLLIVSMKNKCLYRYSGQGSELEPYADFSQWHGGHSNDMVVDKQGRAYVGNIGYDFYAGEDNRDTVLTMVDTNGVVSVVADAVNVPNGSVITEDDRQLILAESLQGRLTEFTINADGSLVNRRVFAQLDGHVPDGICLDRQGCVWAASPFTQSVVRVNRNGDIINTVETGDINPYACVLGGKERRTLFICCAADDDPAQTVINKSGAIYRVDLPVAGAGIP